MDSNVGMVNISRSAKTVNAYLKRGQQLWNRASSNYDLPREYLEINQFISYLVKLLPTLKKATRRQYLASAREYVNQLVKHQNISHIHFNLHELEKLNQLKASDFESRLTLKTNTKLNTSSQKAKQIKNIDLKILIEKINIMRGKWIKPSLIWMTANILVGLRPTEWRYAELLKNEKHQLVLRVVNAKNSNNRAHGICRHIDCKDLASVELDLLNRQLSIAFSNSLSDISWQNYYEGCRKSIHKITRKYLSERQKYPTLYSTRHQFAANAKSSGMTKAEIAALMGHASDQTAGSHYGKKKHGMGVCRTKAIMSEVQRVRIKTDNKKYTNLRLN